MPTQTKPYAVMKGNVKAIWEILKGYFNVSADKENEAETVSNISGGVTFHGANLWVLIFAVFIASLGLNVNSTAVIIGAMLISPLMGPIIGMGLAVGINDIELLKRAAKNYAVATVISVLTAMLYFLVTPLNEAQSELLARTSPTLYDVLIALCGGAAGILALSTKGKGNVIPGVAIATALMPPLCTAGYGLAMGNAVYFFGAFYLFFINTVFIGLATFIGVRLMHFRQKRHSTEERFSKVRNYIIAAVIITMVPAAFMTVNIIKKTIFDNNVKRFVKNELAFSGTYVISSDADKKGKVLSIVAIGKEIGNKEIERAQYKLGDYGMDGFRLSIVQGSRSDSLLMLHSKLSDISSTNDVNSAKLIEQSAKIRSLERQLYGYTQYDSLTRTVVGEMKILFPSAKSLALSRTTEAYADTSAASAYVIAVVGMDGESSGRMPARENEKLRLWLKSRLKVDSLRIIVTER